MPPSYIHDLADFGRLITIGTTTEGLFLDFKRTLNNWNAPKGTPDRVKQDAQKELCRDLAQFANTDGGVLLVGVDETKNADGIKVATGITRVDDFDGMRAWIEQAITNYCVPSTFSKSIDSVSVSGGPIVAINMSPSLHVVYLWDRSNGTIEVVGRNNHGKRQLNPNELERHVMNGSRASRIALEDAIATRQSEDVVLVGGVMQGIRRMGGEIEWSSVKCGPIRIGERGRLSFPLAIPIDELSGSTSMLSIPYELVRACWVDVAQRLNLFLHVRVTWDGKNKVLTISDRLGR